MTLEQLVATIFGWIAVCGTILAVTYMIQYAPVHTVTVPAACVEVAQ